MPQAGYQPQYIYGKPNPNYAGPSKAHDDDYIDDYDSYASFSEDSELDDLDLSEFDDEFSDEFDFGDDEEMEEYHSDYIQEYSHEDAVDDMVENLGVDLDLAEELSELGFYRCAGMEEYDKTLIQIISDDYNTYDGFLEDYIAENHLVYMSGLNITDNIDTEGDEEHRITTDIHNKLCEGIDDKISHIDGEHMASITQSMLMYTGQYYGDINQYQRDGNPRGFNQFHSKLNEEKERAGKTIGKIVDRYAQNKGITRQEVLSEHTIFDPDDETKIIGLKNPVPGGDPEKNPLLFKGFLSSESAGNANISTLFDRELPKFDKTQGVFYDKDTDQFSVKLGHNFDDAQNGREIANSICYDVSSYIKNISQGSPKNVIFRGITGEAASNMDKFSGGDTITMENFSSFSCSPVTARSFLEGDNTNNKPGLIIAISDKSAPISGERLHHSSDVFSSNNNELPSLTRYDEKEVLVDKGTQFELLNRFEQPDKILYFVRDAE